MHITEERLFASDGKMLARTETPLITDLHEYITGLRSNVAQVLRKRYKASDGTHSQPACVIRLYDGRTLIVIMARGTPHDWP